MNRKSFFNKPISKRQALIYRLIRPTFPDTFHEDGFTDDLGWQVIHHPNVTMEWVNHTHTKYSIFDDEVMLTGSINIEGRHRGCLDYIGDPEINAKIAEVACRGVKVVMLFSRKANIGNDINYKAMHELYRSAAMDAFLSDRMIHSKLVMVDGHTVVMGSANFSVFSMQMAEELNVVIHSQPELMARFHEVAEARRMAATRVESAAAFAGYNRRIAGLQQWHQKLNEVFN